MKQYSSILRSLCIAVAVCCALDAHGQNIVVDGGFENTPSGSNSFSSAWTLTPPAGQSTGQQFSNVGTSTTFARSGENYANLAPEVGQTGLLTQNLTTTAGQRYTLSFYLANDSEVPTNFFRAVVSGTELYTTSSPPFPSDGSYVLVTASFTANTSTTTLEFQYRHDDDFWRLDDVSVVPEASANRLQNISTRLRVLTGDNVLIGGFIISGTDPKKIMVRAIGPSLSSRGVEDPLLDPTLELYRGDVLIAQNDNYKDTQQQEIEQASIPPPTDERESAIIATVPANGTDYTAIVRGKNGNTGVAVVEIYDLESGNNSRLANISSRGFVTTGENVMIGGFIIGGGQANARIVVRAIGPSLAPKGVNTPLNDPTVQLVDEDGTEILANDNWRQGQEAEVQATGLQPTDDRESALIASLPPDNYTAIVRGKDGTTGVALVEVYQVQ